MTKKTGDNDQTTGCGAGTLGDSGCGEGAAGALGCRAWMGLEATPLQVPER